MGLYLTPFLIIAQAWNAVNIRTGEFSPEKSSSIFFFFFSFSAKSSYSSSSLLCKGGRSWWKCNCPVLEEGCVLHFRELLVLTMEAADGAGCTFPIRDYESACPCVAWFSLTSGCFLVDTCDTLKTATQFMAAFHAAVPGVICGVKWCSLEPAEFPFVWTSPAAATQPCSCCYYCLGCSQNTLVTAQTCRKSEVPRDLAV